MKLIIVILVSLLCFTGVNIPQTSQAAYGAVNQPQIRLVGYDPYCRCPMYVQWVIVGYDYYRRPIWGWRPLPVIHRCGGR